MKKFLPGLLITVCFAAFAAGLVQLFLLRYDAGDVYPPYSSLRADPLGTMAFYESLQKIPGLKVARDFSTANVLPEESHTTYLHLASDRMEWKWLDRNIVREIEDFVTRGGRLVLTFPPEFKENYHDRDHEESETNSPALKPASAQKKKKQKMTGITTEDYLSIAERWGVGIGIEDVLEDEHNRYKPVVVTRQVDLPLPDTLNWHSGIVLTNLDNKWRTIYARHRNGVVIERTFGKGTIVIASDSYFISNEALWKDRQSGLLAWLVGPNPNVVFDEAHFGVVEQPGVATLMRKYRLHGLVGALVILAGLFIWKNSVSLVPPLADEQQRTFVTGKDSTSGFVNLLRRNVSTKDILNTCFNEWKKSAPQTPATKVRLAEAEKIVAVQNTLPSRERTPVATYRKISEIFAKSSGFRNAKLII